MSDSPAPSSSWQDATIVAFDTETSGSYPINDEIVEIGAVKWRGGQIVDQFQTLVKPANPMSEAIIKIHNISNEMVANAPSIAEVLPQFHEFIGDAVVVAHHAPFDLGFMTYEFERLAIPLPRGPVLCTSLLSIALIGEAPNHRLQTLVGILNIPGGKVHRAFDDARACLYVALECCKRVGENSTIAEVASKMGKLLAWPNYLIRNSGDQKLIQICQAVIDKKDLQIIYDGGTLKGIPRRVTPKGLVRNPDGDFLYAICHVDRTGKRFYLNRLNEFDVVV